MQPIPTDILGRYGETLQRKCVPQPLRSDYLKWLRYFLHFRTKYPLPGDRSVQVKLFAEKLRAKGQSYAQVEQAAIAVSLFFASHRTGKILPG